MPPSEVSSQTVLPMPQRTPGKLHWLSLLLLLAASVAVRVYCLSCKPFWFDECYSVELARINWRNFLRLLWWREANMSLYYVLLRAWLHFGQSPFFIRGLSAAVAAATLPAIYWLARLLYDRRVALIAAALFAFNAFDVRYAQEARSYALFVLLATISSAFLVAWLREPARPNRLGYVVASILAVYAHLYALLLIVAQWIAVRAVAHAKLRFCELPAARNSKLESLKDMRRAWIAIAVAVAPLLIFVIKTGAGPIRWIQRPGVRDVLRFYEHLAGCNSWVLPALYAAACVAALAPAGAQLFKRTQTWETWRLQFLLIWLIFPVALTVVLSFARPVFLARYMIFCLPPLLILVSAGLARLRPWWLLAITLSVILLLASQGIFFVYSHDFDNERDASGAATNFILDHTEPGDGVIFHIAATRVPYEFFRSIRAGQNTASPQFTAAFGPEILYPKHAAGLDYRDFTGKPTADLLRSVTAGHPRVWVMLMDNGPAGKPDPASGMLTQVLAKSFPKMQRWQFPLVEVRLYSKQ
jgi:4-amino-4-deoxy-L-arabinose transferase-like glycosyltransferase